MEQTTREQELIDAIIDQRGHTMNTLIDIYNRDAKCGGIFFYVDHRVINEMVKEENPCHI